MACANPSLTVEGKTLIPNQMCDFCGRDSTVKYCQNCEDSLCETCEKGHSRNKYTRGHTVVDISVPNVVYCKQHSECALEFSCKNCKCIICELCKPEHKGHTIELIGNDVKSLQFLCTENIPQLLALELHLENDKTTCTKLVENYTEIETSLQTYKSEIIELTTTKISTLQDEIRHKREHFEVVLGDEDIGLDNLLDKSNQNVKHLSDVRTSTNVQSLLHGLRDSGQILKVSHDIRTVYNLDKQPQTVNDILPNMQELDNIKQSIIDTIEQSQKHIQYIHTVNLADYKEKTLIQKYHLRKEDNGANKQNAGIMSHQKSEDMVRSDSQLLESTGQKLPEIELQENKKHKLPIMDTKIDMDEIRDTTQSSSSNTTTVTETAVKKKNIDDSEDKSKNESLLFKELSCDNLKQECDIKRKPSENGYLICETKQPNPKQLIIYEMNSDIIQSLSTETFEIVEKSGEVKKVQMVELQYSGYRRYIAIKNSLIKIYLLNENFKCIDFYSNQSQRMCQFKFDGICCGKLSHEFLLTETKSVEPYVARVYLGSLTSFNTFKMTYTHSFQLLGTCSMVLQTNKLLTMLTEKPFGVREFDLEKKCVTKFQLLEVDTNEKDWLILTSDRDSNILIGYPNGQICFYNSNFTSSKVILDVGEDVCGLLEINGQLIVTTTSRIMVYSRKQ